MADNWYYVQKGNRQGPVGIEVMINMVTNQDLKFEDFVWKKGFDNWKKIKDVPELHQSSDAPVVPTPSLKSVPQAPVMSKEEVEFRFANLNSLSRSLFIRTGNDRGEKPSDYGPFSLKQIKQLFKENRINGKSFIFSTEMNEWKVLADVPDYLETFEEQPPALKDADRRSGARKPFVARLFVHNNKKLFEGLCRDISIGGMQVLVDDFKGVAGDKISINVHPENSDYHFSAEGVVVRILEGHSGFSFRFQKLEDEARKAIEKYIQDN